MLLRLTSDCFTADVFDGTHKDIANRKKKNCIKEENKYKGDREIGSQIEKQERNECVFFVFCQQFLPFEIVDFISARFSVWAKWQACVAQL